MFPAYRIFLAIMMLGPFFGILRAQYSGFGIKGGPQLCTYKAIKLRTTIVPGGTLGVYAPISLAARLEVQPELLLTMMGSGFVGPDGDKYHLRTYYIQAPITAKYFLGTAFNVQGGGQLGALLAAQRVDANGGIGVRDRFNTWDVGLNAGVGIDTRTGTDLTLRYYSGLSLVMRDSGLYPHNRSLQVTLGKRLVQTKRKPAGRRRK